jgi:PmbA protein
MVDKDILRYCLDSLKDNEIDKSQCILTRKSKYEMNVESQKVSLLRTNFENDLNIIVIKDDKKGSISINKIDQSSIDEAIKNVIELSKTSQDDDCYDISQYQQSKAFEKGDSKPDLDKMYSLLKEFIKKVKELYPKVIVSDTILEFNHVVSYFTNSNGVDYKTTKGLYNFSCLFSSKEGEKSSSFNYTGFSIKSLERDLLDSGSVKELIRQSVDQLNTKALEGKFTGDIIITPDCLSDFVNFYVGAFLSDRALISGTSILKGKLEQLVASPHLSLHSKPVSEEISDGYFVTPDGFEAENVTIIDKGILKSFMLSLYGANKTMLERAKNAGGCYVVDPGDKSFEDMVKGVEKGILIARFSGGNPSASGDFSGVAKNSYYIENGEIKYPVSETMVAGNIYEAFNNIKDISKERIDFGFSILPWICCSGITISGR